MPQRSGAPRDVSGRRGLPSGGQLMGSAAPIIPESAPFSPEQREWLNGFLAGLFSAPTAEIAPIAAAEPVTAAIYFASQSGTAERLAKKLAKQLKAQQYITTIGSIEKLSPNDLARQTNVLLVVSTYGEGDPPDSARSFRDALFSAEAPRMSSLRYSVFCLGDKHYENFCKFGVEVDERLSELGATRLCTRVECDVEVDQPFAQWAGDVTPRLADKTVAASAVVTTPATAQTPSESLPLYTRDHPYLAELRERTVLTASGSTKTTMHLSLALDPSALPYEAGDACGVIAHNDPCLVAEILSLLPFSAETSVELPKLGAVTIEHALLHHLQPTRLTRKIVQAFAEKTQCRELLALLPAEQGAHLDAFMHGRGLIDLLESYRGAVESPQELVAMLPRLAPRLYSISSSPKTHHGEVHCTVAVVRYRSHNRERGGIASTMLEHRIQPGERIPIYIQPNKRFRIPSDASTPMIMIGPGTGIAPFRAFLHERRALGHSGRNWLFFGERSAKTDFFYEHELRAMVDEGHLSRLDTAFSRDQAHKLYVQDRMQEHGAELWRWLQDGAQIYVCGDATRMAKDVDATLHRIVEQHGGFDHEAASEYVAQLNEEHRYHRDVY